MTPFRYYFIHSRFAFVVGFVLMILLRPMILWASTPESPEVKEMVKRAATYLSDTETPPSYAAGGAALIGLALYKADAPVSHPKIQAAIKAARGVAEASPRNLGGSETYTPATCFMFLAEVDPLESRPQLELLLDAILARQHPSGAWGYRPTTFDDTSQAQYGLLCLWAAHQLGLEIPVEAVERAALWFVRSMHSGGGWSYRPLPNVDPTKVGDQRHVQVTHSMAAAGAGSLYVCSHLLGFAVQPKQQDDGLPPALTKVEETDDTQGRTLRSRNVTAQTLKSTMNAADVWFSRNLSFETTWWTHYYMYGLERYMSFRELVQAERDPAPAWYRQGVEFLRRTQREDGSWQTVDSPAERSAAVHTALAILFLTRSSRSMIQRAVLESGILIGGHGLPKNLANVRMEDGRVVTPQMVRDVDDLLDMLRATDDMEFDARELPGGLSLDEDLTKRTSQLERLRTLVTDPDFHARYAAVKTLARSDDLDNVPALIHALTDGDRRVAHEANQGLRFISRKLLAYPLPSEPTIQQKWAIQSKWKNWFLSIRPDAEFMD